MSEVCSDRTVMLECPRHSKRSSTLLQDSETWLSLIEQDLSENYKNYIITSTQDAYLRTSSVSITFDSIDDAVIFKLKHQR